MANRGEAHCLSSIFNPGLVRNEEYLVRSGSEMKLLIVDPDRDLVEMLKNWLKTLGYEVYRAYTGERAKIESEEQEQTLSCWTLQQRTLIHCQCVGTCGTSTMLWC